MTELPSPRLRSTAWLAARLDRPEVVAVDASYPPGCPRSRPPGVPRGAHSRRGVLRPRRHRRSIQRPAAHAAGRRTAKQLDYVLEHGRDEFLAQHELFKAEREHQIEEIDRFLKVILEANEPTVLEDGNFATLLEIAQRTFAGAYGDSRNLLTPEEVGYLSIRRGSRDAKERLEIESHVTHTYRFLSQIPWTTELQGVPAIAYAHHEKLSSAGRATRTASWT